MSSAAERIVSEETSTTASGERRSSERIALEVDVTLTSDSQFFAGLSGDVSQGGLFVQTYKRCEVGSQLLLEFTLPTGPVRTTGVVRWVRPGAEGMAPGMGVIFENLSDADRKRIQAFCKARPPLYHDEDEE
jgi:uncharacterized protein (TIGR02266 family)